MYNYLWLNYRKIAFIGAGALVNKDVAPYALIIGVPGRQIGWMSEYGKQLDLPLSGDGFTECENTKEKYILKSGVVKKI